MFLKKAISGGCRGDNRRARSLCKELGPREVKGRVVSAHWRRPLLAAEGMLPAQPQGPDVERSVRVPLTSFSAPRSVRFSHPPISSLHLLRLHTPSLLPGPRPASVNRLPTLHASLCCSFAASQYWER